MALKRARSEGLADANNSVCSLLRYAESDARSAPLDERVRAGQKLREFLIGCFVSGAIETASTLTVLCSWITAAGGLGVADLATAPEDVNNASRRIHGAIGSQFKEPEIQPVYVPAHAKRTCQRSSEPVSLRLPSTMLLEMFGDIGPVHGPPPTR